jgi:hypothetical protein
MTLLDELWGNAEIGNLEGIAEVALLELKDIDIHNLNSYANSRHEILITLYKTGWINNEKIESVLREAVVKCGRTDYDLMRLPKGCIGFFGIRADRLYMPEVLAYCIEERIFSEKELERIPLKRKETIESFVETHKRKDLLAKLRTDLLHPWPEIRQAFPFDIPMTYDNWV